MIQSYQGFSLHVIYFLTQAICQEKACVSKTDLKRLAK